MQTTNSGKQNSRKQAHSAASSLVNKGKRAVAARINRKTESFDDAVSVLARHRANYIAQARKIAIQIAMGRSNRTVVIDEVREKLPPPAEIDPRVMGAIFAERKVWQGIGYENSVRSDCHHRPVKRFKLIAP